MSALDREGFLRVASTFYNVGWLEGEAFREAPETKRFQGAWKRALESHDKWQDIVERIGSELPGMSVGDTTAPYATAARRCCVYMVRLETSKSAEPHNVIVGLASVLVPYYHLYQIAVGSNHHRGFPQPRPRAGDEGSVADLVARHIEQEMGYKEFPAEYESIIVPEISVQNVLPGRATLMDALFDTQR